MNEQKKLRLELKKDRELQKKLEREHEKDLKKQKKLDIINAKKQKRDEKQKQRMQKAFPEFDNYISTLSDAQNAELNAFFSDTESHLLPSLRGRDKIITDFKNALLYYSSSGIPFDEALSRLSPENLGGFYARPPIVWYSLDDAAKIYPLSMKHGQMAMFRLSVYLKKEVVPEILQMALTFTIKRFPSFATTVKKGFFWHYLDASKRRYAVKEEDDIPCRPLIVSRSGSQSFRVVYYKNRISAEYFHVLTDGTGGMIFLKTLTAEYLRLLGNECSKTDGVLDTNGHPTLGETANEFDRAEKTEKRSGFLNKTAIQLSGKLSKVQPCRVIHFKMNSSSLLEKAKSHGATVTAYILALMFMACRSASEELSGDFSVQVPVNMRKYYPSDTLRNFALYCGIRFPAGEIGDVAALLPDITTQLHEKGSKEAMAEMMNSTEKLVRSVRFVPLRIKTMFAGIGYGYIGESMYTTIMSNLGVQQLPPEITDEVKSMDFVLGTALTNRAACTLVSYGGITTLSVSKLTTDPSFEEHLLRELTNEGITVETEGSAIYES